MCLCFKPPDVRPNLEYRDNVTKENVNAQIQLRKHLISCELVGTLYPAILYDEIDYLFAKFPTARSYQ